MIWRSRCAPNRSERDTGRLSVPARDDREGYPMRPSIPARGDRLHDFTATDLDGSIVSSRRFYLRANLLVVFTHEWPCGDCVRYLQELDHYRPALHAERCQPLAVVPLGSTLVVNWPEHSRPGFPVVLAEQDELHRPHGFVDERGRPSAGIVLADDTATIWHAWEARTDHRFPDADDLLEWVRYVSYQCPECWDRVEW